MVTVWCCREKGVQSWKISWHTHLSRIFGRKEIIMLRECITCMYLRLYVSSKLTQVIQSFFQNFTLPIWWWRTGWVYNVILLQTVCWRLILCMKTATHTSFLSSMNTIHTHMRRGIRGSFFCCVTTNQSDATTVQYTRFLFTVRVNHLHDLFRF